jgi:hypothetical protein
MSRETNMTTVEVAMAEEAINNEEEAEATMKVVVVATNHVVVMNHVEATNLVEVMNQEEDMNPEVVTKEEVATRIETLREAQTTDSSNIPRSR